jgi:hypothetical protein
MTSSICSGSSGYSFVSEVKAIAISYQNVTLPIY